MDMLVSVIVVTYNSAQYVLETLESIKDQIYTKIELIITDDCSTDNTIQIVEKWVEQNKSRFINVYVVESGKNTGISANCNRGLKKANGKYFKLIAGDDLLLPNCIEDNINLIQKTREKIIISRVRPFTNSKAKVEGVNNILKYQEEEMEFLRWGKEKQYKEIVKKNYIIAPAMFVERDTLKQMGDFDERFLMEDYPFWIKVIQRKMKILFLDKETVAYRIHEEQCCNSKIDQVYKKWLLEDEYKIFVNLRKPYLPALWKWNEYLRYFFAFRVLKLGNTMREYHFWRLVMLLSPIFWANIIKKVYSKI